MSADRTVEEGNLDVIRRAYAAFAAGDLETVRSGFAPDAQWREPARGMFGGDYCGVDAILDYFRELSIATDGTFRSVPEDMAASGDRVYVLMRDSATRHGKTLEDTSIALFTLSDGKVVTARIWLDDAGKDFWS